MKIYFTSQLSFKQTVCEKIHPRLKRSRTSFSTAVKNIVFLYLKINISRISGENTYLTEQQLNKSLSQVTFKSSSTKPQAAENNQMPRNLNNLVTSKTIPVVKIADPVAIATNSLTDSINASFITTNDPAAQLSLVKRKLGSEGTSLIKLEEKTNPYINIMNAVKALLIKPIGSGQRPAKLIALKNYIVGGIPVRCCPWPRAVGSANSKPEQLSLTEKSVIWEKHFSITLDKVISNLVEEELIMLSFQGGNARVDYFTDNIQMVTLNSSTLEQRNAAAA